jgi:hypothetical protein
LLDACKEARARAILTGTTAELVIHPIDKTIEVPGGDGPFFKKTNIPEDVGIEILGVNFVELQEAPEARVKFFPNGTSDEFTIVYHSDGNEVRKISLEIVTGIADVEDVR